jgi:hypothetical protein
MAIRTTESTVTFNHPFRMSAFENFLPAGTYRVVTDEEEIIGLSFLAYQKISTILQTPSISASRGLSENVPVQPADLAKALEKDFQQTMHGSGSANS